jgi:poly-beta-hydroxybutyrate-responsive repressor
VQVRIERFVEPALLLLLSERPRHGYELAHEITQLAGDHTGADIGNLYRVLRGLEFEGLITSQWVPQPTGPPRRTYDLSPAGARVLATWARAMEQTQSTLSAFLTRYDSASRRATSPRS